ncbi:MAG: threonine--tRNA ligase [Coprothermobacterota bacterium]|nr:threonine--tRNA ligase [Coprothermobacterota bacterium]
MSPEEAIQQPPPQAIAALIADRLVDVDQALGKSNITWVTADTPAGLEVLRHSTSHLMAQAVLDLYPKAKLAIGPAIADGFYYDFDLPRPLSAEDLPRIEERMRQLAEENSPFERRELSREDALVWFADHNQDYKVELINNLSLDELISLYQNGSFVDLCRGPHAPSTGSLKHFKLLSVAGAYWRGDEHKAMLQRIYGTAFASEEALKEHLWKLEEAAKRDHRRLGKEMDIFSTHPAIGAGLILWHPAGSIVRHEIENFWTEQHLKRGYQLVYTPHIASEEIYKVSGHLEAYGEMMYAPMDIDSQPYRVKPMNCPAHICIFQSATRSYRDLPIRYAELGTVYRYERSGVLHGLLRVRGFTQDDAHVFCRPEQLKDEVHQVLDLTEFMMKTFGYRYQAFLATRPARSIGSQEEWTFATDTLRQALQERGMDYQLDEGGGAFYAPKIDIKLWDALGRSWQGPTCQVDLNLPVRFSIAYMGEDGREHRCVMIHRTVLGSMERFIGGLLEHYGGNFPLWLAPRQAVVIPITSRHQPYAQHVADALREVGMRVEVDARSEKMNAKIRDAEMQRIPFALIVGDREAEAEAVSVRRKGKGDLGSQPLASLVAAMREEVAGRSLG